MFIKDEAGAEWTQAASGDRWVNFDEGMEVAENFVSSLVGIVPRVHHKMHDLDDAYTFAAGSAAANAIPLIGAPTNAFNGGGSTSEAGTYLAAVGETLERYSAAWVDPAVWTGSFNELRKSSLDSTIVGPQDLRMFTQEQFSKSDFPYDQFLAGSEVVWKGGWDLTNDSPAFVPARLIQLADVGSESAKIGYATSSGLAYHVSPAEAILAGLYELIERDAFMQVWYGRLSLPIIDTESDEQLTLLMNRHCNPSGLSVSLVNMTSLSGIPSVLAVTRNHVNSVAPVALGAAAASSLRSAAFTAAVESLQTRSWMRAEQRDGRTIRISNSDFERDIRNFDDHIRLYCDPEAAEKTDFLTAGPTESDDLEPRVRTSSPNDQIADIVQYFRDLGVRLLAFDMTSPDVTEGGGHVFRLFSPDLQMLDVGYRARFLGNPRLRTHPFEMGVTSKVIGQDELNPLPHPFP